LMTSHAMHVQGLNTSGRRLSYTIMFAE